MGEPVEPGFRRAETRNQKLETGRGRKWKLENGNWPRLRIPSFQFPVSNFRFSFNPDFSPRLDALRGLPEGRGFSPAEIAAPAFCWSRAPRSLRPGAAATAGHGTLQ
jgi:hypothetical protein